MSLDRPLTAPPPMRYIKLGPGGSWAKRAFANGELPFCHQELPHELALSGDEAEMAAYMVSIGKDRGTATSTARKIKAFYSLGSEAIWVAFSDGKMWWTKAAPGVTWLGGSADYASRIRKTVSGWNCKNAMGETLFLSTISSRLTKVSSTQNSMCKLPDDDYAWRKISGIAEPTLELANDARRTVTAAIMALISNLHWADFETLVDLLLTRSGWNRVTALGGSMKDADLEVEQSVTRERAFVQVKSVSNQMELDRYIEIFDGNEQWTRMIYVCHSPRGRLMSDRPDILVWAKEELADIIFRQGMFDWLVSKAG